MQQIPEFALQFGFVNGPGGQHNSRTIMLQELRALFAACPPSSSGDDYRTAIVADNILLKQTMATRQKTLRGMRELYSLDRNILLFGALRDLWDGDREAQPLLALLCSVARDSLLRATANVILNTPLGIMVTTESLSDAAEAALPGRYKSTVLGVVGRNTSSSWKQSGHLSDNKVRTQAVCRPTALAYALLLGHLCDARGEGLFHTLWAQLLDAPLDTLRAQAVTASQRGWIEYYSAGGVTEVGFSHLLREEREVPQT